MMTLMKVKLNIKMIVLKKQNVLIMPNKCVTNTYPTLMDNVDDPHISKSNGKHCSYRGSDYLTQMNQF